MNQVVKNSALPPGLGERAGVVTELVSVGILLVSYYYIFFNVQFIHQMPSISSTARSEIARWKTHVSDVPDRSGTIKPLLS